MIEPEGLLRHAQQLARSAGGRPPDVAVRRGISAAYYAVFHELTKQAAKHLVGSCPDGIQNEIRRSWSHGEISRLAAHVVERARTLVRAPHVPLRGLFEKIGPLLDVVATDDALVDGLRLFNDMQEQRHAADYDHGVRFAQSDLLEACDNARLARRQLDRASTAAREAFFTLLTVRRADFRRR